MSMNSEENNRIARMSALVQMLKWIIQNPALYRWFIMELEDEEPELQRAIYLIISNIDKTYEDILKDSNISDDLLDMALFLVLGFIEYGILRVPDILRKIYNFMEPDKIIKGNIQRIILRDWNGLEIVIDPQKSDPIQKLINSREKIVVAIKDLLRELYGDSGIEKYRKYLEKRGLISKKEGASQNEHSHSDSATYQ